MTEEHINLILGALLHDIGKVIYRTGERKNHSQSGYEFLKDEIGLGDNKAYKAVLESVHYHHGSMLGSARISADSPAYITYIADNIASAADRRENSEPEPGFDAGTPLESIFNHMFCNDQKYYYSPKNLSRESGINFPVKDKKTFSASQYAAIKKQITDALKAGIEWNNDYINSILEILEATMTYIPSSTSKKEVADISLYDHMKITAAIGSCIYKYLKSAGRSDYKKELFDNAQSFYKEKAFILYSMDISGIQSFIYTITSKGALRMLRAKSFYLEIFMENMIDELLAETDVSRANLIYCGGGHMYALLPNTDETIKTLEQTEKIINQWLLKTFKTELYVASGYAECSAESLQNKPAGSYKAIYQEIGRKISAKKMNRYTPEEIMKLNASCKPEGGRECRICKTVDNVNEDGLCEMCASLEHLSADILYKDFFTVRSESSTGAVPVMEGRWLVAQSEDDVRKSIKSDTAFVRTFSKNAFFSGKSIASKLWVGDYTTGQSMNEFGEGADGIKRVAVLRMDVDNLGKAFVSGFEDKKNDDRYVTISRTATFSRQMTIFFKYHINEILSAPVCCYLEGDRESEQGRQVSIVYSGGDDIFLVGAWDEVVEAAVDIRDAFKKFSQGQLSISGGIGLYYPGYPIHVMAEEVGGLEDIAKLHNKDAVTLFEKAGRYEWDIFSEMVIGEKYITIRNFFENSSERGKSFLYNLLELVRNRSVKINFARYVYILARLEPSRDASLEERENYNTFSRKMYSWIKSEEDSRQLITAIYLYAYQMREREDFE